MRTVILLMTGLQKTSCYEETYISAGTWVVQSTAVLRYINLGLEKASGRFRCRQRAAALAPSRVDFRLKLDLWSARELLREEAAHQLIAFRASNGSSQCFGCIVERSLLGSPLVVVGKSLKLSRNRLVSHGFGSAKQSLRCLHVLLASW